MKYCIVFYCVCLLVVVLTGCQDSSPVTSTILTSEQQGLTVDENSLEVVVSPDSPKAIFKFILQNKTSKNIRIDKVTPSCECVLIKSHPMLLISGSSTELIASIAFGDKYGSIKQQIIITDDVGRLVLLNLTAHRPLKLTADPEFIQAPLDEMHSRSVVFVPAVGVSVTSVKVSFNNDLIHDVVAVRDGMLEVSLARINLANFRQANLLKVSCTFSDENIYERAIPIYVVDQNSDAVSR